MLSSNIYKEEISMSAQQNNVGAGLAPARDLENMSFEERLQLGAENAVRCMGITDQDRIFIMTDAEREGIASRIVAAALARHADVSVHFLEHYGTRPLTVFSDELRNDLLQ